MSRASELTDLPPVPSDIERHIRTARDAERTGDLADAKAAYERALYSLEDDEHAPLAITLLRWTGNALRDAGDGAAAIDCFVASLAAAETADDDVGTAHALNCIASVRWQWGELDAAADHLQRARTLAATADESKLLAMVDQNLGIIASIRGRTDRAIEHYERSLEQYRAMGENRLIAQIFNNLGMLRVDLEEWDEAEDLFERAAELADRADDFSTRIMVETNRTELYILQSDSARALESCNEAFALATRYHHHRGLGEVHRNYGGIYRERGEHNLAEMHLRKALEIAERYSNTLLAGEVQREIAQVYRALDRNQDALRALNRAHAIFQDLQAPVDLADVGRRISELEEIFLEVVSRWGESIESKDRYTAGHCERVADYSCMLAESVGFESDAMIWFRMGAFLHDVGKMMVPAEILNKQGPLTDAEWEIMRQHTIIGEDLLASIDFPWDLRPMIRSHHERWDGSGYPDELEGDAIPISARILSIADAFDALTTTRSYRTARAVAEALAIMQEEAGRRFDPNLFTRFRALIEERLAAGRLPVLPEGDPVEAVGADDAPVPAE